MSSPPVLRFPRPRPLKAVLTPRDRGTPQELRALLETFIRERPGDLAPLATWFRISLTGSAPRRRLTRGR